MTKDGGNPLIILTPVYEDNDASSQLFFELAQVFQGNLFVVAVDDGSIQQPLSEASLSDAGLEGEIIRLKRNVGHQRAIAIGLNYISDKFADTRSVVIMDSDGEDKPNTIRDLLNVLDNPSIDVAVAMRASRVETIRFRLFYIFYKMLFKLLTGRKINFGNFMILTPRAVARVVAMQELWIHIAGCVLISKLRIANCSITRGARYAGQSKMNFVGLVLHGFKSVMIFAEDVLVRAGIACSIIAVVAILGAIVAFSLKLLDFATPGWFSITVGVLFLVFLQTGALTLMMLMLTGVVRGGLVPSISYREFIDQVVYCPKNKKD